MNARWAKKTLSTIDVARLLGVAVSSVSKWIDEGTLAAGRTPGGHRRVEREALLEFLRRQRLSTPLELLTPALTIVVIASPRSATRRMTQTVARKYSGTEVYPSDDAYGTGEAIGLWRPDVLIVDLQTPDVDGLEVCRRVRSNPALSHVKIIVAGDDTSAALRSQVLGLGASAYLKKPLTAPALLASVERAMRLPSQGPVKS